MNVLRLAADVTGRVVGTAASYALTTLWPTEGIYRAADDLLTATSHQHRTQTQLDEIAEHLSAIRALLEDNTNASAAGIPLPAAERPAPEPPSDAGHPNHDIPCGHRNEWNGHHVDCSKPAFHDDDHAYGDIAWINVRSPQ